MMPTNPMQRESASRMWDETASKVGETHAAVVDDEWAAVMRPNLCSEVRRCAGDARKNKRESFASLGACRPHDLGT
jgi:hypothetical protein